MAVLKAFTGLLGPTHHSATVQLGILVATGIIVALITHFGGETGNVELLVDNIHVLGGAEDVRMLRTLIPASLFCVASGAAMGPEAPLVQTTGSIGTVVAQKRGCTTAEMRVLTIVGMAAGFAVLFGAPLGSAIFALEILHRRGMEYVEALVPACIGALCGFVINIGLDRMRIEPVWRFPDFGSLATRDLAVAAVVGLVGALGAWLFSAAVGVIRAGLQRLPAWARYVAGGLGLGLLGFWSPFALTFAEQQIAALPNARMATSALFVAAAAKFVGTSLTLAAGWKGGFIIPLFFMGATMGFATHQLFPELNATVLAACAMVALCVSVTKTPIGTTLVVTEMAGLSLLPVTVLAAIVAMLAADRVGLIETQRSRAARDLDPVPTA